MRLLPLSTLILAALLPAVVAEDLTSEDAEETVSIAALLQNEDLLDALIMGDETPEEPTAIESNRALSEDSEQARAVNEPANIEGADEPLTVIDSLHPQWDFGAELSMGVGYKENVLFSAFDQQDSAFTTTGLEATLFRIAPARSWQFFGYFLAENAHYLDVEGLDDEWLAIALLQTHKTVGPWKFGLAGQYTFLEQAFSLSFEDLDLGSTKIVLNQFSLKPSLEYSLWKRAYIRIELPIETDRFGDSGQNYNEFGAQLSLGHRFERGGKVEGSYRFELRDYSERLIRDRTGIAQSGTHLEWEDHRWDLSLDYYLDAAKTWRSKTLLRLRRVVDNGSGYDNFWMYRAQQKLIYKRPTWEFSVSASYSHYDYDTQTIEPGNPNHRHRSRFSIGCDFEKSLSEDLTLSIAYGFEDYLSNIPDDVYSGSVISIGLGYSF